VDGDAGYERWQIGEEWKSSICPRRGFITEESRAWLRIFSTYRAGHLLVAGGVLDQPAIYIAAMTLVESLVQEAQSNDDGSS
jgi:hypothetical protein